MAITAYTVTTGYWRDGATPRLVDQVSALIAQGWVPYGSPLLSSVAGSASQPMVSTGNASVTGYIIVTGYSDGRTPAIASPGADWVPQGDTVWLDRNFYLQAYVTGTPYVDPVDLLTQVKGVLPIRNGGTGGPTLADARANLKINKLVQNSGDTLIVSPSETYRMFVADTGDWGVVQVGVGPKALSVTRGGTGALDAAGARTNLGLGSVATENTVPVAKGGTGSTTAAGARANLGIGAVATDDVVPVAKGGTGGTTVAAARTNLALDRIEQRTGETVIFSDNFKDKFITARSDNSWGFYNNNAGAFIALPVGSGGTGALTAAGARTNLALDRIEQRAGETVIFSDAFKDKFITARQDNSWGFYNNNAGSFIALPVSSGGTGALNSASARTNLGLGSVAVENTVPVSKGGTGSTSAAGALSNLGGLPRAGDSGLISRYRFNNSGGVGGIQFDNTNFGTFGGVHANWQTYPVAFNLNVVSSGTFAPHNVHRYFYGGVAAGSFYTGLFVTNSDQQYVIGHASEDGVATCNYSFSKQGSATANNGTWISNSDERIKEDVKRIEDPLEKMRAIKGVTWVRKEGRTKGIGFIAQDVQKVFPDAVFKGGDREMPDGTLVKGILSPDTSGVAAALHHEAILVLMDKIATLESEIAELKKA